VRPHKSSRAAALRTKAAARKVAAGKLKAEPSRVFPFEEVREAHRVMEANEAGGKMVVVIG
jgi:NADPH:quinone reductase